MHHFTGAAALALSFVALVSLANLACSEKSDATLAFEVDQELSESPVLAGTQIEVSAQGGVVTLRGVVSREDQRMTAENLARGVQGVESVESQIEVASSSAAAPPVGAGPPDEPAPSAPSTPDEADPTM